MKVNRKENGEGRQATRKRRIGKFAALMVPPLCVTATSLFDASTAYASTGTWKQISVISGATTVHSGIAVNSAGDLFVTEPDTNRVYEGTPTPAGTYTWTNISDGGSFDFPSGIAVDGSGELFVTNLVSGILEEGTPTSSGAYTWKDVTNFGSSKGARGIAVGSKGELYVTNPYSNTIEEGTPTGTGSYSWKDITNGGLFNEPAGIAVDSQGDLFVANFNSDIVEGTLTGTGTYSWKNITGNGSFDGPYGMALDSQGELFVTNYVLSGIEQGTPTPQGTYAWKDITGNGSFSNPTGIAMNGNGDVFVTNDNSNVIDEYSVVNAASPTINIQPHEVTVSSSAASPTLTVGASVSSGQLSYQWYSNSFDSNTGGTPISGADYDWYSPSNSKSGTTYYYVVVTNTNLNVDGVTTASTTSQAAKVTVQSSADTLSGLTISSGTLSPVFGSGIMSYTDSVDNSVNSITLTPTVSNPGESVSVSVNGNAVGGTTIGAVSPDTIPLQVGDNRIAIQVTALDGMEQTYTLDVNRALPTVGPSGLTHKDVTSQGWTESWQASPGALGYIVILNNHVLSQQLLKNTSFSVTAVNPNQTYKVSVIALFPGGNYLTSAEDTVTTSTGGKPLSGQLPEVSWAGGLPLLGLMGAGAVWFVRRQKGKRA